LRSLEPLRPLPIPGLPAARVAGTLKVEPEDFVVEEIELYQPSGEGVHVWAWVEKRELATQSAVMRIAEALHIDPQLIGYAGLKDTRAVTRQWLSIEGTSEDAVRALDLPALRILEVRRHGNRLKIGHLRGNRFRIRVRGAAGADLEAVRENLRYLSRRGLPNWVGEQRFGREGDNLSRGLSILAGDVRRAGQKIPKRILRLIVSAVQSEVFNRVLARRLDDFDLVHDGDVAWLHRNGACFLVDQAVNERVRCERFEISPSGPLPGPRCLAPKGAQAELERAALAELGVEARRFGEVPGRTNEGARRPLRVPLRGVELERADDGFVVAFELDKGAFATSVMRELLVETAWVGESASGAREDTDAEAD
jgi:tRNA pseudouridine13 synthase